MAVVLIVAFPIFVVAHTKRVPGAELHVRPFPESEIDTRADLNAPTLLGEFVGRSRVVIVVKPPQRGGYFPDLARIGSLHSGNTNCGNSQGDEFFVHSFI